MKEKFLKILRENRLNYLSTEDLVALLGVSDAKIWRCVRELKDEGYDILKEPYRGYQLAGIPDRITPQELLWRLDTDLIGKEVFCYREVTSTNNIARQLAREDKEEGIAIFAEFQRKGRGRFKRRWVSPRSKGLLASFILRPGDDPLLGSQITLIGAVSATSAIRKTTDLPVLIKWPNDIVIRDKKVGGILTEFGTSERGPFFILGIGININTPVEELPEGGVSLADVKGNEVSRIELARLLLVELDKYYIMFKKEGFVPLRNEWQNLSATLGTRVKVILATREIEGQALGIDTDGALVLRLDTGLSERVIAGDIISLERR